MVQGRPVPDEYELAVNRSIADRNLQKKKKREAKAANPPDNISNGEFIFIAGYTSNRLTYGIRLEETDGLDFLELCKSSLYEANHRLEPIN